MIPMSELASQDTTVPVLVRVDATVHAGTIGIGLVADDASTYFAEVERTFLDEDIPELFLKSLTGVRWLIVRNTAPGGTISDVTLHSVRVFRVATIQKATETSDASAEAIVAERWGAPPDDALNWATIPIMERRAGYFGDVLKEYIAPNALFERVLSLCCGHGHFERTLLQLVKYGACDAIDISEGALESARAAARQAGISNVNYIQQDLNRLSLSRNYDWVFAGGVHHLSNLEHVFAELARWMPPGAPFMMYEYIGPNQCQPTARQLEAINACIRLLPEKYRLRVSAQRRLRAAGAEEGLQFLHRKRDEIAADARRGSTKGPISKDPAFANFFWQHYTPMTAEEWNAVDPSESVRSQDIIPVLKKYFAEVDVRFQGGSIVQFTLYDIAANFYGDSEEVRHLLEMLIHIEEVLTKYDPDVPQNYAVIVARNQ
jgi:SAM-dependent methyltransferase